MFVKFIWNRGEAVKRNTAIADFDMGGIKMFHVNSFFNSLKMSWIKKLANEEVAVLKNIALYHVSKTGLRIDLFKICNCSLKKMNAECIRTIDKMPMFYSSMIKSWFSTKPVVYKHIILIILALKSFGTTMLFNLMVKLSLCVIGSRKVL